MTNISTWASNMSNITTVEGLVRFDNEITSQYYAPYITLMVFLVVFLALGRYQKEKSFVVASFFASLTASFLWIMGILQGMYLTIWIGFTLASLLVTARSGSS